MCTEEISPLQPVSQRSDIPYELVIITGMSGAGKTEALHTFEDLSFYCIDNIPPFLLRDLIEHMRTLHPQLYKFCVVCDIRAEKFLLHLHTEIEYLSHQGVLCRLIFLECDDEILLRRYSQLRRRHPLHALSPHVEGAIRAERQMLSEFKEQADFVIDTTSIKAHELKELIRVQFSKQAITDQLNCQVFSFGFKHGMPVEADVIIDVRFLPNPFYIQELRNKTGFDEDVVQYVMQQKLTQEFLEKWFALLDTLMPGYVQEGKRNISIGIGCTGGQHRSVTIARITAQYLRNKGYNIYERHRDVESAHQTSLFDVSQLGVYTA